MRSQWFSCANPFPCGSSAVAPSMKLAIYNNNPFWRIRTELQLQIAARALKGRTSCRTEGFDLRPPGRDPGARRYAQQLVREGPPAPELVAEDGPDERDPAHQRDQRANGALVHAPAPGHVADELRVEPLDAAAQDARGDLSHGRGDQGLEGPEVLRFDEFRVETLGSASATLSMMIESAIVRTFLFFGFDTHRISKGSLPVSSAGS